MPDRYHHGGLPDALLDAVGDLIRESGLEHVTLRAAARRAGVSHAAPAHHFGDKAGLLTAFATRGFDAFTTALTSARDAAGPTPAARIRAMGAAYVGFAHDHGPWMQVMFRPELLRSDDLDLLAVAPGAFTVLLEQVAAGLGLPTGSAEAVSHAVATWASVHGVSTLLEDGPVGEVSEVTREEVIAATLDTTLAGLRAHPRWVGG